MEVGGKVLGMANSPDSKNSGAIHGSRPGMTWAENSALIQQMLKPTKMIENTSSRLWYAYDQHKAGTAWYVAVPGKGNLCTAQISFQSASFEPDAKKIVQSIAPAK